MNPYNTRYTSFSRFRCPPNPPKKQPLESNHTHRANSSSLFQRNLPPRGFRPSYYLLGMGIIVSYGFYRAMQGIREKKYESSPSPRPMWPRSTKPFVHLLRIESLCFHPGCTSLSYQLNQFKLVFFFFFFWKIDYLTTACGAGFS